ncbi:high mobility group B protein 3-like [Euphorbia lathyris]|uniref:high mobility group B protein 3-like n=1 Tax=Euphorbia lathyris TaxID=212925 RepID=UPI003313B92F
MKGLKSAVIAHKKPNAEMLKTRKPTKEKASKKNATAKDPDAPKRPPSAFFVFMDEFRKSFKENHPDNKSVSVVGKAGGEKWKSMSDSDKAPYIEKALKKKAEYAKARDAYDEKKKLNNKEDNGKPAESEKSSSEVHDENEQEASS